MGILRRMEFAGADAVCVSADAQRTACNVPTIANSGIFLRRSSPGRPFARRSPCCPTTDYPCQWSPTLHRSSYNRPSEHIHPAGIFHHVRMEVVRLQLEML
jgi:hypothetical protein